MKKKKISILALLGLMALTSCELPLSPFDSGSIDSVELDSSLNDSSSPISTDDNPSTPISTEITSIPESTDGSSFTSISEEVISSPSSTDPISTLPSSEITSTSPITSSEETSGPDSTITSTEVVSTPVSIDSTTSIDSTYSSNETPDNVEGNYQYFIQSDSSANRSFMRTPYIPNIISTASKDYYDNAEGKSGSSLLSVLKSLVSSASTSYAWERYETVDEDPYNSSNVWCIYVRDSYGKNDHVSGNTAYKWNREHTYPQSKLTGNAKSDSQLIFADDWKTNGVRSNNKYGEVTHSSSTAVKDSGSRITANWSSGGIFEPCDAAKGEVARATLYTYLKYNEPITDNFQSLALCLKWHNQFPPTSWEMLRNNRNEDVQGNRNPFIDHPEYADLLF